MVQSPSQTTVDRRCPNCGTRVARDAESCFMCGQDLRVQAKRAQRVSWVDALLVLAVLLVLGLWWGLGGQSTSDESTLVEGAIPPEMIPELGEAEVELDLDDAPPPLFDQVQAQELVIHTVTSGETLVGIAGRYGVSVEALQEANNLTGEIIRPDEELLIPRTRTALNSANAELLRYTVQSGDTIVSIARTFGSTEAEIVAANGLQDDDLIRAGDSLVVPISTLPQEAIASSVLSSIDESVQRTYVKPQLTGPASEAAVPRTESVLLRWVSVDVLQENEWYVLQVYPVSAGVEPIPSIWTKSTSHRLEAESYAPVDGTGATYVWQVSVVRVRVDVNGLPTLQAASPLSDVRQFTWQ